jgi:hypothetical protein
MLTLNIRITIMANYGINREVDLKSYLPQYMAEEEFADLIGIFEDVMNEMYESKNGINVVETSEVRSNMEEFAADNDTQSLLHLQGKNGLYYSSGGNTNINEDHLGTELNPNLDGATPILFPNKLTGPENLQDRTYSTANIMNIQAVANESSSQTSIYDGNKRSTEYRKGALWDSSIKDRNAAPNFNSFWKSNTVSSTKKDHLSILDKIHKLIDLKDPSLIDFEYIQYFADYLGYDLNLNLFHFEDNIVTKSSEHLWTKELHKEFSPDGGTVYYTIHGVTRNKTYVDITDAEYQELITTDSVADSYDLGYYVDNKLKKELAEKQVRALIENLPYWYKIKGTDNSLKILLYSFGLVAEVHNFYTSNYSTERKDWDVADVYYNTSRLKTTKNNVNSLSEDFTDIPDNYYPTPHFQIRFDINETYSGTKKTGVLRDMEKYGEMIMAIHAAKPINDVFQGLVGILRTSNDIHVLPIANYIYRVADRCTDIMYEGDTAIELKIGSGSENYTVPTELHLGDTGYDKDKIPFETTDTETQYKLFEVPNIVTEYGTIADDFTEWDDVFSTEYVATDDPEPEP